MFIQTFQYQTFVTYGQRLTFLGWPRMKIRYCTDVDSGDTIFTNFAIGNIIQTEPWVAEDKMSKKIMPCQVRKTIGREQKEREGLSSLLNEKKHVRLQLRLLSFNNDFT